MICSIRFDAWLQEMQEDVATNGGELKLSATKYSITAEYTSILHGINATITYSRPKPEDTIT